MDDFKHFLPRLLELLGEQPRHELWLPEVLLGKLRDAGWLAWPERERGAVTDYLHGLWDRVRGLDLASELDDLTDTYLCAIGRTGLEMQPLLDAWLRDDTRPSRVHLACFAVYNVPRLADKGRLSNPHWDQRTPGYAEVSRWITSKAVRNVIEETQGSLTPRQAESLWRYDSLPPASDT